MTEKEDDLRLFSRTAFDWHNRVVECADSLLGGVKINASRPATPTSYCSCRTN